MNEILPADPSEEGRPAKTPGRGLSLLALLLALLAAAAAGWLIWQEFAASGEQADSLQAATTSLEQQLSSLDKRVSALDTRVSGLASANPDTRLKSIEQELANLNKLTRGLEAFQAETSAWTHTMQAAIEGDQARLAGLEARLAALSAKKMSASAELDLAEIDYVLRLAQERLQLFGDTRTADQALAIADQQIAAFDNPLYLGLQREIAAARQSLSQTASVDYSAVYRLVDNLQSAVGSLPFKGSESPAEAAQASDGTGWWARIKGAFSGLVTVRRQAADEAELPVLADQEMIRQHAWLELEVARLAAMRRDQDAWTSALSEFSATLQKWFAPDSGAMKTTENLLSEARAIQVDPPLPDISAPWVALQAVRASGVSVPAIESAQPAQQPLSPPDPGTTETDDASLQPGPETGDSRQ